jgi:hypothetical protein
MRRTALALGASVLALALGAGPAAAEPGVTQAVTDTTGAAQVGAVAVNAPIRVLSDGDSQSAGVAAATPQTTSNSTGAAQVSSVEATVPVRVLSDGDDSSSGGAASGTAGDQSTTNSRGAAQVGSPAVSAPVRVLSDGDNASADEAAGASAGPQTADGSSGTAQVGSPRLVAPIRILSGGQSADEGDGSSLPGPSDLAEEIGTDVDGLLGALLGNPGGDDVIGSIASALTGDSGGGPMPQQIRGLRAAPEPYERPVVNLFSGQPPLPEAGDVGSGDGGTITVLAASEGELPLTGAAALAAAFAVGLALLSGGTALRRMA